MVYTLGLLFSLKAVAQIPYFAATVGDGKLYGYTSVKFRPGINHQETYTTFQYGLGDHFATGVDLYTGPNTTYWGTLVRYGLYLNGAISANGRLFWCTNTWWVVNHGSEYTFSNYEYLGYSIPLKTGHSITPMVGAIHSWKMNQDVDIAAGFYYTLKNWNFYLWGNDFLKSHPRIIIGIDFAL